MLKDEYAAGRKQVVGENEVWYLRQFLECVGRVGKDEIKLLTAVLYKAENVGT